MDAPRRKDVAEAYRLAVAHGIVEPQDAVAWADRAIAASDEVDPDLIEVASVWPVGRGQVATALGRVRGPVDPEAATRLVLVLVDARLSQDIGHAERLATALYRVAVDALEPGGGDLHSALLGCDDAFSLARSNTWGTIEEAQIRLVDVIRAYRAQSLE